MECSGLNGTGVGCGGGLVEVSIVVVIVVLTIGILAVKNISKKKKISIINLSILTTSQ